MCVCERVSVSVGGVGVCVCVYERVVCVRE